MELGAIGCLNCLVDKTVKHAYKRRCLHLLELLRSCVHVSNNTLEVALCTLRALHRGTFRGWHTRSLATPILRLRSARLLAHAATIVYSCSLSPTGWGLTIALLISYQQCPTVCCACPFHQEVFYQSCIQMVTHQDLLEWVCMQ
jgi:hypothetical protein